MKENTAQCIANCLRTSQGSHVLYRTFGLEVVDDMNVPMRRDILIQLSTYYPEVSLNNVAVSKADIDGKFEYTVDVRGN